MTCYPGLVLFCRTNNLLYWSRLVLQVSALRAMARSSSSLMGLPVWRTSGSSSPSRSSAIPSAGCHRASWSRCSPTPPRSTSWSTSRNRLTWTPSWTIGSREAAEWWLTESRRQSKSSGTHRLLESATTIDMKVYMIPECSSDGFANGSVIDMDRFDCSLKCKHPLFLFVDWRFTNAQVHVNHCMLHLTGLLSVICIFGKTENIWFYINYVRQFEVGRLLLIVFS